MEGKYILNGSDLFTVFGTVVEDGSGSFLSYPQRKPSLQNDWNDKDGIDIDLQSPKFNAREFRLKCAMLANSRADFWDKYNGLFTVLSAMGVHELFVGDLDKTYTLYYKQQQNLTKLTRLGNNNNIGIKFDLIFGETDWTDNMEKVYLVDDQGRYLIA